MEKQDFIPLQQVGQQTDATQHKVFYTAFEAAQFYEIAKHRLLEVNQWQEISVMLGSKFVLFGNDGVAVKRTVQQSDYIRIDIPGPGTEEGKGYDWVSIEHLEEINDEEKDEQMLFFIARPSSHPEKPNGVTSHFFSSKATSTFMIFRQQNTVNAEVHGRNELPNLKSDSQVERVRNLLVNGGSAVGLSFLQWELLVKGILANG